MRGITTTAILTLLLCHGAWSQLVASFEVSDFDICKGESITFTDNSTNTEGNIISWDWTFQGGSPATMSGQGPHTVYFYSGGTYPIKLIIEGDNGNVVEKTIAVTVHQLPTAYATNNGPVCSGSSVELMSSGSSGNSFLWTGPNGFTSNFSDVTIPFVSISEFGIYTVEVSTEFGCKAIATTELVKGDGADLTMSKTDVSCFGYSDAMASVVATNGVAPYNYNWFSSVSNTSSATNLSAGWQVLSVTDANHCYSIDSIFIDEPPEMIVDLTSTPSKCYVPDGSATAAVSGGTPGYSFSWSPGGGSNATITSVGPGEYVATVMDARQCKVYDTVNVDVVNEPVIQIIDSSDVTCFGNNDGSIETSVSGGTPSYTYNWSPSVGGMDVASGLAPGIYSVSATDDKGCNTDTLEVTISEPDSLSVNPFTLGTICGYQNGEIVLDVSGGSGSYSYLWSHDSSLKDTVLNLGVGTYVVTVSDSLGCSQTLALDIDFAGPFDLDIVPPNATIHNGDSVGIAVEIDPNINVGSISWTPTDGLSCVDCLNPIASPSDTTVYVVEVTSSDGCSSKDSVSIVVKFPCGEVFVPTIFSPDGDGVNDFECIKGRCIVTCEFIIFNRWGEAVFQTTDNNECWDGIYKGKMVESGIYVYKLNVTKEDGETVNKTGNITVVR